MKYIKQGIYLIFTFISDTPIKYVVLFGIAVAVTAFLTKISWVDLLNTILPLVFSALILGLAIYELWKNRTTLDFVYKVYFRSGLTAYLRAFLIAVVTITVGTFVYLHVPEFMRWGWSQLIFNNSGNIALQPLETAYQAGQKVNEIPDYHPSIPNIDEIPEAQSEKPVSKLSDKQSSRKIAQLQKNNFVYTWLFMAPVWILLMLVLPFWAEIEEKVFRQGVHTWKGITINSVKFGLVHLTAGIPICWALTLSITGLLFAFRYKYVYQLHLRKFQDENKAQEAGVQASTADHAIYNAMVITFIVVLMLLAK